jgi:selenoprotein W-related protein
MTDKLLATFGNQIARLSLRPSSGGRYEVTIDGELVYSKKATGKHPAVDTIIAEVRRRLPPSVASQSD